MKTTAAIPNLVDGVALGQPPRKLGVPFALMVSIGDGKVIWVPLFLTTVWAFPFSDTMALFGALAVIPFLLFGVLTARKKLRLLANGRLAQGTLLATKALARARQGPASYELTFKFLTNKGEEVTASVVTERPATLRDDALEPLLYDPEDPSRFALLDALPGTPRIGADGRFHVNRRRAVKHLAYALLPVLLVAAFVWVRQWFGQLIG